MRRPPATSCCGRRQRWVCGSRSTWSTAPSARRRSRRSVRPCTNTPTPASRSRPRCAAHRTDLGVVHRRQAAHPAGQGRVPGADREGTAGAAGDHRPVPATSPTGRWRTCRTRRSAPTTTRASTMSRARPTGSGSVVATSSSRCSTACGATLQRRLADEGYRIRIYLPYGTQWYPYLMRRMAERPANLLLFVRSLISG